MTFEKAEHTFTDKTWLVDKATVSKNYAELTADEAYKLANAFIEKRKILVPPVELVYLDVSFYDLGIQETE